MRHPNFEDARPLIEDEIERLIGVLDLLELDPDLEENGDLEPLADDEPSVGAPNDSAGSWEGIVQQYDIDCELDDCDLEECFADEAVPRATGRRHSHLTASLR